MSRTSPLVKIGEAVRKLSLLGVYFLSTASAGAYPLPLPEETPITSTFGEYRARHFHGGVDFSTGGETGMEVHSVASGYVWRIRVSGSGYGRALYINLDDGRTAVYAHLNDFSPRIEEVAAKEQRRVGKYRIDYILPDTALRVSAGELIAHSGESGAGPAHLHFELRKGDFQINPLAAGVQVTDSRPPRIRSLILVPLGPGSLVDGRNKPLSVGVRWDRGSSRYRTTRVPTIEGDVAVACRLYDLADGKPNRLAPYGAALFVDGVPAYDVCFDGVSLLLTHHVEYVYNYDYARRGGRNVLNLFCVPGSNVGLTSDETALRGVLKVERTGTKGSVPLSRGRHTLRVEAWDFVGNRRAAEIDVMANNRPALLDPVMAEEGGRIKASALDPDGDAIEILVERSSDSGLTWAAAGNIGPQGSLEMNPPSGDEILRVKAVDEGNASSPPAYFGPGLCRYAEDAPMMEIETRGDYLAAAVEFDCPSAHAPELWLVNGDDSTPIKSLRVERTGPATFRAAVQLSDSVQSGAALMAVVYGREGTFSVIKDLSLTHVRAGNGGDFSLPGGALLEIDRGTFAQDAFFMSHFEDSLGAIASEELIAMCRPYRCDPPTQFFGRSATLYLPLEKEPANEQRVGIYQKSGERSWSWVGGKRRVSDLVGGDISHFSVYALMEDVQAPRVAGVRPRNGSRIRNNMPTLSARLRDKGSGLDWDSVYFTMDGQKLITAWEAERGKAWVELPYVLSPGKHTLEVRASDRAGNETAVESTFFVAR